MKLVLIKDVKNYENKKVQINGWVYNSRRSGKIGFLMLRDGHGIIQCIIEKKHIGDQEYFKTKLNLRNKNDSVLSFETKRNLVTNSAEFYNLSYEYLNDCLRAGLVYRREFYNDSELEAENSLMFKITLTPFGDINSPTFNQWRKNYL